MVWERVSVVMLLANGGFLARLARVARKESRPWNCMLAPACDRCNAPTEQPVGRECAAAEEQESMSAGEQASRSAREQESGRAGEQEESRPTCQHQKTESGAARCGRSSSCGRAAAWRPCGAARPAASSRPGASRAAGRALPPHVRARERVVRRDRHVNRMLRHGREARDRHGAC